MDIRHIIETFAKSQTDIDNTIVSLRASFQKEERLWAQLELLDSKIFANERVIGFLADFLQMVNDESRLKLFSLQDIEKIYRLLVQYYPDNLQYRLDLISFVHNVLDNEKFALELIEETIKLIDQRRASLQDFLEELKGE
ncbi:hypothetical protein [Pararcticibacter amylolyticus]|uniref:Uncharacterized protein n=1 Tax=Pararcticibacter amylolyticus TaxID=2173175 RepID=A0A2U2P9L9_9SPHI|nr:hypothetical protein [Pararcticibacter amylolyticus]PWG78082.1 hypothetical protein DDR33_23995 [Pararcticibacter amylolyticus]